MEACTLRAGNGLWGLPGGPLHCRQREPFLADVAAAGSTGPGPMRVPPRMDSTDPELELLAPPRPWRPTPLCHLCQGKAMTPGWGGPGSPAYTKVLQGPGLASSSHQPLSGPRAGNRRRLRRAGPHEAAQIPRVASASPPWSFPGPVVHVDPGPSLRSKHGAGFIAQQLTASPVLGRQGVQSGPGAAETGAASSRPQRIIPSPASTCRLPS